jgi:DNA-directed RNA polymerase II subunit RPB9
MSTVSSDMLFCKDCSSMLYPREDKTNRRLLYACRNCAFSEPAQVSCVYTNELKLSAASLRVAPYIQHDPTLQRTKRTTCTRCENKEAVYFSRSAEQMELVFVCTNPACNYYWMQADSGASGSAGTS